MPSCRFFFATPSGKKGQSVIARQWDRVSNLPFRQLKSSKPFLEFVCAQVAAHPSFASTQVALLSFTWKSKGAFSDIELAIACSSFDASAPITLLKRIVQQGLEQFVPESQRKCVWVVPHVIPPDATIFSKMDANQFYQNMRGQVTHAEKLLADQFPFHWDQFDQNSRLVMLAALDNSFSYTVCAQDRAIFANLILNCVQCGELGNQIQKESKDGALFDLFTDPSVQPDCKCCTAVVRELLRGMRDQLSLNFCLNEFIFQFSLIMNGIDISLKALFEDSKSTGTDGDDEGAGVAAAPSFSTILSDADRELDDLLSTHESIPEAIQSRIKKLVHESIILYEARRVCDTRRFRRSCCSWGRLRSVILACILQFPDGQKLFSAEKSQFALHKVGISITTSKKISGCSQCTREHVIINSPLPPCNPLVDSMSHWVECADVSTSVSLFDDLIRCFNNIPFESVLNDLKLAGGGNQEEPVSVSSESRKSLSNLSWILRQWDSFFPVLIHTVSKCISAHHYAVMLIQLYKKDKHVIDDSHGIFERLVAHERQFALRLSVFRQETGKWVVQFQTCRDLLVALRSFMDSESHRFVMNMNFVEGVCVSACDALGQIEAQISESLVSDGDDHRALDMTGDSTSQSHFGNKQPGSFFEQAGIVYLDARNYDSPNTFRRYNDASKEWVIPKGTRCRKGAEQPEWKVSMLEKILYGGGRLLLSAAKNYGDDAARFVAKELF